MDAFFLSESLSLRRSLAAFRLMPRSLEANVTPSIALKLIDALYATWKNIPLGKYFTRDFRDQHLSSRFCQLSLHRVSLVLAHRSRFLPATSRVRSLRYSGRV